MFVDGTHPVAGPISYGGSVAIIDGAPFVVRRHASAPGKHTNEIVGELDRLGERITQHPQRSWRRASTTRPAAAGRNLLAIKA